jgi:hypothetical protein
MTTDVVSSLKVWCSSRRSEKIYIIFVAEKIIKFDEVRVVEEGLNFYLSDELLLGLLVFFCRSRE